MNAEDLIFYSDKDNNIYSGGFNVNSIIMKNGSSPIATLNQNQKGGDNSNNVSDLFQHLVVPNWTFTLPIKKAFQKQNDEYNHKVDNNKDEDEYIDEDLHSKLLSLIAPKEKDNDKINTKIKIKTKTKKNKNKNISILKKNKTKKFLKK